MDSIQVEQLSKELIKLDSVLGIIGAVLVNKNGLTIISRVSRTINEKKIGALTATIFEAMETAITELNEEICNITVEYDKYQVVIREATSQVILVAFIEYNIDLGIALIEVEESLINIQEIIKDDESVNK